MSRGGIFSSNIFEGNRKGFYGIGQYSDPWATREAARARQALMRTGAIAGVGQDDTAPPAPARPSIGLMIGWGAAVLAAVGIFWGVTRGGMGGSVAANRRRSSRRRSTRRNSRRRSRRAIRRNVTRSDIERMRTDFREMRGDADKALTAIRNRDARRLHEVFAHHMNKQLADRLKREGTAFFDDSGSMLAVRLRVKDLNAEADNLQRHITKVLDDARRAEPRRVSRRSSRRRIHRNRRATSLTTRQKEARESARNSRDWARGVEMYLLGMGSPPKGTRHAVREGYLDARKSDSYGNELYNPYSGRLHSNRRRASRNARRTGRGYPVNHPRKVIRGKGGTWRVAGSPTRYQTKALAERALKTLRPNLRRYKALSAAARRSMPDSSFALSGKRFPIKGPKGSSRERDKWQAMQAIRFLNMGRIRSKSDYLAIRNAIIREYGANFWRQHNGPSWPKIEKAKRRRSATRRGTTRRRVAANRRRTSRRR